MPKRPEEASSSAAGRTKTGAGTSNDGSETGSEAGGEKQPSTLRTVQVLQEPLQAMLKEVKKEKDRTYYALDSLHKCCICLDAVSSVLFMPCLHLAICDECATAYLHEGKCPICRASVDAMAMQVKLP